MDQAEINFFLWYDLCRSRNKLYVFVPEGMFGRVDFSEDGRKMRENEEIKLFRWCLVERERRENDSGAHQKVFSLK